MEIPTELHGKLLVRRGHLEYCLRRDNMETIYIAYCRFRDTIVEVGHHDHWKKNPGDLRKYMNLLNDCETKMRMYGTGITGVSQEMKMAS